MIAALLFVAIAIEWLCCFGLLAMRNPFDRLHAIAPASILPPILIATAVVWERGFSQAGIKSILVALILIASSPIVTHALARAARIRETDHQSLQTVKK